MIISRILYAMLLAGAFLHLSAQPLITEEMPPHHQNVRAGAVIDVNGDVDGDDYDGFTLAYAVETYRHPTDQMVISYTHLNPHQSTMRQVLFSVEEYWPIAENLSPYGSAGAGYLWIDYDEGLSGESSGWFGKLGLGILYEASSRFDLYAEIAYQVSNDDLWVDGRTATKSNNTQAILGVRMKY